MAFRGLPPEALSFLRKLKRNNRREWFQAHKDDYERFVKAPMAELVLCIGEGLRRVAPEIVADPKTSLYRIYRDTRFSHDKTPYKTHAAAVFPVRGLLKNSGPGLYFHFSPEELLIGGGIYMPDPPLLRAVREEIAAHPRAFLRVVEARPFRNAFGQLEGERLKSMPKGFSPEHPAAQYIRYKQFLFGKEYSAELASSTRLLPAILDCFEKGMPLIRFLTKPAKKCLEVSDERMASELPGALR
jgi:uncharacterized protein (TIGR02453 family)